MMFLSSKRREKDGFQMTGAADAVFQSERVFMGQSDSFRAFGFILNCRHCAVSSAFRALDRHVLPSIAKNGRSIATDLARLPWKFKKSLTKSDFRAYTWEVLDKIGA